MNIQRCPVHGTKDGKLDMAYIPDMGGLLYYIWRCDKGADYAVGLVMGPVPGLIRKYRHLVKEGMHKKGTG